MFRQIVIAALLVALNFTAQEPSGNTTNRAHRSSAVRRAFRRAHPCPSTNATTGRCPGFVIDHIVPLCAGGPDEPANMQWQTAEDAREKDREERMDCGK